MREADYDRPETLVPAFTGAGKLLLIPSAVYGQRYPQMQRAITAAAEAGVGLVAYASFVNTGTSTLRLGQEHKQAETAIRASRLQFVLLRNGAYTEMYTETLGPALQYGAILGSADDGKLSAATRADLAVAAAVVLAGDGHQGKVYELGGTAFTMVDLAAKDDRARIRPRWHAYQSQTRVPQALRILGRPATRSRQVIAGRPHRAQPEPTPLRSPERIRT